MMSYAVSSLRVERHFKFSHLVLLSLDNVLTICYAVYTKGGIFVSQTTLNVRMDEDVKRRFDEFCADVGMNASVAVNLFVKTVIRERRIPFEITSDPFWSEENQTVLRRSIAQLDAGRGARHELIEVDADA